MRIAVLTAERTALWEQFHYYMFWLAAVKPTPAAMPATRSSKTKANAAQATWVVTPEGWNHGNRIHFGNLILGRIALLERNIEEARSRLVAAGETPGSPQLNSFGPDMTLAQELLAYGEADVVLEYLSLCSEFWELDRGKLERWTAQIKNGQTPDFRSDLRF